MLQGIRGCCCSGLRALILTQRASCQLQQGSLEGALGDCCAALAAEPGSPDALHLKYQVATLKRSPNQPPQSETCIRLPSVLYIKRLQPVGCPFSLAPVAHFSSAGKDKGCKD